MHERQIAVAAAMEKAGVVPRIRVLHEETKTAAAAAAYLGCPVGAIANSLIFDADGDAVLVMASGAAKVDTDKVAAVFGANRVGRATPAQVRAATGQVIGGVAPTGHPRRLRTVVDVELKAYEEIWAAAGTADSLMSLTYPDLLVITAGTEAVVRSSSRDTPGLLPRQ
ncbi:hypothetical protein KEM60_01997 [Austwickia sp. TVS 96-490-7B]|uniref:YbaK/EbsC family protein n=1 Tax=Austwickia sp. TVS 96-490-7B TaxID=2830843 RepID=UPI001E108033|nr:YbaK/EbsC family protein [Austwickia sp. TVS 96-490-7B]MBW3085786.1 hypothetical protein [Austwickia sp. TVS 96-490-7B]